MYSYREMYREVHTQRVDIAVVIMRTAGYDFLLKRAREFPHKLNRESDTISCAFRTPSRFVLLYKTGTERWMG